ncbi:DNA-binding protein [Pavlovales sp. CCMP2436]|nr:DNA-binding protein [Pavlovales sp. CCMP2436]
MATAQKQAITLKGSVAIVTEFFGYSVNSILYQRGIYPPETFKKVSKYGLTMLVTTDTGLSEYLEQVLGQLSNFATDVNVPAVLFYFFVVVLLTSGRVCIFLKFISSQFLFVTLSFVTDVNVPVGVSLIISEPKSYELRIPTLYGRITCKTWEESDPKYIAKSEEVKLRSFTTKIHKVDAAVSYLAEDD